jgi:hypothetical protein
MDHAPARTMGRTTLLLAGHALIASISNQPELLVRLHRPVHLLVPLIL